MKTGWIWTTLETVLALVMVLGTITNMIAELFYIMDTVHGIEAIKTAIVVRVWQWFALSIFLGYWFNNSYQKLKGC